MKKMGLFTSLIWAFAIFCSCGQCLAEAAQAREAGYYTAAETIFDEAYREQFSAGFSDIASTCETAVGNRFYSLKQSGKLFYYDVEAREYTLFAHLPARPHRPDWQGKSYADLSESDRETLDHTVSQLIAAVDSNVLYGYCATSGRIGTVDADGIHWSDVRLDNSLLMEQMGSDELSLEPLWNAYIEGTTLYTYWNPSRWTADDSAPCSASLLAFDLRTGQYTLTDLAETYSFCPYKPGQMLLLRRADDGAMDLCAYDLSSHTVTDERFPPLPVTASTADFFSVANLIGGIAYHSSSDMLVLVAKDGVWQSLKGEEFVHTVANDGLWTELNPTIGGGWMLENGAFLFSSEGDHLFS